MHVLEAAEEGFDQALDDAVAVSRLPNPLYLSDHRHYYRLYAEGQDFRDHSFVVLSDGRPQFAFCLTSREQNGELVYDCYGQPAAAFEAADMGFRLRRRLGSLVEERLASIAAGNAKLSLAFRDFLVAGELSLTGKALLSSGGQAKPHFTQVVDLQTTLDDLRASMTKSTRWGVNWGLKNLEIAVTPPKAPDETVFWAFRDLHLEAAGRSTRSHATWQAQLDAVRSGQAFCVFAWLGGELVSAGFFPVSQVYSYYGVSASRRDLFDKPISHAVLWTAIVTARDLGCRHFELGDQLFDKPAVSAKEMNIANFKRSFGGATSTRLDISWTGRRTDQEISAG
ncbi:MAG: hypothetical protein ACTS10_14685 [Kiloniellales bacterium]